MDWEAAIEWNRQALTRVLAMLVAMAGLGEDEHSILPRHLHRAVLRLLRPAEAAARRLVIAAARGLVALPAVYRPESRYRTGQGSSSSRPPLRLAAPTTSPPLDGGEEIPAAPLRTLPLPRRAGERCRAKRGGVGVERHSVSHSPSSSQPGFRRFDPLTRFRPARRAQVSVPRISTPGFTRPFFIPVRPPLLPDDPVAAAHLAMRLAALGRVLDDLPRHAKRFARWRSRVAAGTQREESRLNQGGRCMSPSPLRDAGRPRAARIWPLRPGRPPGSHRRPSHEIHTILGNTHGLALWALRPDTS